MDKVVVKLIDYPKLENEWILGPHTLRAIVQSAGIKSFTKVDVLTYTLDEYEFTWFVLRWW